MRRRQVTSEGERAAQIPAELAAGPCVEVWVDPDEQQPQPSTVPYPAWRAFQAWRRYNVARERFAEAHRLTDRQTFALMPARTPYSALYLVECGREDRARELLGCLADELLGPRRPPMRQPMAPSRTSTQQKGAQT